MRHITKRLRLGTISAAVLFTATIAANPTDGSTRSPLAIQEIAIHGSEVTIAVANLGQEILHGTVGVRIVTSGGVMDAMIPVIVTGGRTASVGVDACAPVASVMPLGVVLDDGVPF